MEYIKGLLPFGAKHAMRYLSLGCAIGKIFKNLFTALSPSARNPTALREKALVIHGKGAVVLLPHLHQ